MTKSGKKSDQAFIQTGVGCHCTPCLAGLLGRSGAGAAQVGSQTRL